MSTKSKGKGDFCDALSSALDSAKWLNGAPLTEESVQQTRKRLLAHKKSCQCMKSSSDDLILSVACFQMYRFGLQRFQLKIFNQEDDYTQPDENAFEQTSTAESKNTRNAKFDGHIFPHLVNEEMEKSLLTPLRESIGYLWDVLMTKDPKEVSEKLFLSLKLSEIFKICYHTFAVHGMTYYQVLSARLMAKMCKYFTKDVVNTVSAYHFLFTVYVELNMIQEATKMLTLAKESIKNYPKQFDHNFEWALVQIDDCILDIYNGRFSIAMDKLVKLNESKTVNEKRVTRKCLKIMILLIMTKLPSRYVPLKQNEEFTELHALLRQCLSVWHRQQFYSELEERPRDEVLSLEEESVKVLLYNLSLKTFNSYFAFFVNTGLSYDLESAYNCLLAITRRNCIVQWSIKLLLIGSKLDQIIFQSVKSTLKLEEALSSLTSSDLKTQLARVITVSGDSASSVPLKEKHNIMFQTSEKEVKEGLEDSKSPKESPHCAHKKLLSIRDIEMILRKNVKSSKENLDGQFAVPTQLEEFEKKSYPLNLYFIEVLANLYLSHNSVEPSLIEKLKILATKNSSYIEESFFKRTEKLKFKQAKLDFHEDVIHFRLECANILAKSAERGKVATIIMDILQAIYENSRLEGTVDQVAMNYSDADLFIRLLYSVSKIYCEKLKVKPSYLIYDAWAIESNISKASNANQDSPPKTRQRQLHPQTPARTKSYKMEVFKDYVKDLRDSTQAVAVGKPCPNLEEFLSPERGVYKRNRSQTIAREEARCGRLLRSASRIAKKEGPIIKKESSKSDLNEVVDLIDEISISDTEINFYSHLTLYENWKEILKKKPRKQEAKLLCENFYKMLYYFGNRPPIDLYSEIHRELFTLNHCDLVDDLSAAAYHLTESCHNTIRYRALAIHQRKNKLSCDMRLSIEYLNFEKEQYHKPKFLSKILSKIPESWRIVQIHTIKCEKNTPDLLISRFQKGKKPIIFEIKTDPRKFTLNFMDELNEILSLSDAIVKKKDKRTFWTTRVSLDERFASLLNSVGETWLGPFKGILLGECHDTKFTTYCKKVSSVIKKIFGLSSCLDENLLDVVVESFLLMTRSEFRVAITQLFPTSQLHKVDMCYDALRNVVPIFWDPNSPPSDAFEQLPREPVGLILDNQIVSFPFESLSISKSAAQQFFRVPSLRFLITLIDAFSAEDSLFNSGIDSTKTFYVLNPENNLARTEAKFKEKFLDQKLWNGTIGSYPDAQVIKSEIESKDLYIYFGHGSGSSCFKEVVGGLDGLTIRSLGFVVGCSSGKLYKDDAISDSVGTPYRYLLNGCPGFLGVLWDVTDGDIDRYADRLMSCLVQNWNKPDTTKERQPPLYPLLSAMLLARAACNLQYSTGAAPVLYGLPVSFKKLTSK